jgi:hypothetical protein
MECKLLKTGGDPLGHPLRDKVMDLEARAKQEVNEVVWKLAKKQQLFWSISDYLC